MSTSPNKVIPSHIISEVMILGVQYASRNRSKTEIVHYLSEQGKEKTISVPVPFLTLFKGSSATEEEVLRYREALRLRT